MAKAPGGGRRRPWRWLGFGALVAVGALMIAIALTTAGDARAGLQPAYAYPEVTAAPPLDLVDHRGRPFDLVSLRGAPVLVYFGYTHCPDVCPATIGTLNEVIAAYEPPVRALFVTVDPERDTVEFMGSYIRYFSDDYTGLTGTPGAIRAAADGYGVTYARVDTGSAGGYAMAHTAEIYLIDAAGRLRAHYPFGVAAEDVVRDLTTLATE
ncbi:MAG TPA: SCO family protein [Candidatus Limnocylindrales bacterium]|nr:SCO family protein [Candidatus Limnocylindrales bacterium]